MSKLMHKLRAIVLVTLSAFACTAQAQDVYTAYQNQANNLYNQQIAYHAQTTEAANKLWQAYGYYVQIANQNLQNPTAYQQALAQAQQAAIQYFQLWRNYFGWTQNELARLKQQYGAYPNIAGSIDQWSGGVASNQNVMLQAEAQNYSALGISTPATAQQQQAAQPGQPGVEAQDDELEQTTDCVNEVVLLGQHHACVE